MGYFDNRAAASFKESENGETIYYPDGVLGKGRIIKDPVLRDKIYKFHKRLIKYLVPLGALYGALLGLGGGITLNSVMPAIIVGVLAFLRQRVLIRGLPIHNQKLTVNEAVKSSKFMSPKYLIFMMVNGVFCIILGLAVPFVLDKPISEIKFLVFLPVALGVCALALSIYVYKIKKSNQSSNNDAQ